MGAGLGPAGLGPVDGAVPSRWHQQGGQTLPDAADRAADGLVYAGRPRPGIQEGRLWDRLKGGGHGMLTTPA
jgi:hypothetical protein